MALLGQFAIVIVSRSDSPLPKFLKKIAERSSGTFRPMGISGHVAVPTGGIDFWRGLQGHFGRILVILGLYFFILRVF